MAGGLDRVELPVGYLSISSSREPEDVSDVQNGSDHRPSASSSERFFPCETLSQGWEDDGDEDSEPKYRSMTEPTPVEQDTNKRSSDASSYSNASGSRQHAVSTAHSSRPCEYFDLEPGEVSDRGLKFVAFKLVKKYPYLYVGKANQVEVATFFKENLLNKYAWDFFYIMDPAGSRDPLLLVPSAQFEYFLKFTNVDIEKSLTIPRGAARNKFFLAFGGFGTPVPRYMGRVTNEGDYEDLRGRVYSLPQDEPSKLSPAVLQTFKNTMHQAYSTISLKKKKNPEDARLKRIERQKSLGRMTKRVQWYLGLRARAAYASGSTSAMVGWNVEKPAPFITDSFRFVCVDVEAYERNSNIVTEIGLAVLDTEDVMDIPPGKDGGNWFPEIKTFHFRISEYSHMVNYRFVHGCPDSFNFGKSEFVSSENIARRVGSIIGDSDSNDKRSVILVGHGVGQDLNYLKMIGYNVWRVPHVLDEIDTNSMYQRLKQAENGRGLQTICRELQHPGHDFHNAGNDAYYTLQSMIVMAFRQMLDPTLDDRPSDAQKQDGKEWSDGERDDGGLPQKSKEPVDKAARQTASRNREPQW